MRYFILLLVIGFSAQALAGTKRTCQTLTEIVGYEEKGHKYSISFEIMNLKKKTGTELKKLGWDDNYEVDIYVKIKPDLENNPLSTLNVDPYARLEKDRHNRTIFKITADNIGMNYATLVLYKNSDYKRGYVITEMYGEEPEYAAINCN